MGLSGCNEHWVIQKQRCVRACTGVYVVHFIFNLLNKWSSITDNGLKYQIDVFFVFFPKLCKSSGEMESFIKSQKDEGSIDKCNYSSEHVHTHKEEIVHSLDADML